MDEVTVRQNVGGDVEYVVPRKPTPNLTVEIGKPNGVDDAFWAELTPKQKAVVAHRLLSINQYKGAMK